MSLAFCALLALGLTRRKSQEPEHQRYWYEMLDALATIKMFARQRLQHYAPTEGPSHELLKRLGSYCC